MRRVALACLVLILIHLPFSFRPVDEQTVVVGQSKTRVRFDFTDGAFTEAYGRLMINPKQVEGGELKMVARGTGWAIQFPPVCHDTPNSCPRAILEADPAAWLNPGAQEVKWGASVRLEPGMTATGENIVQKGVSAGAQYKLQVDGQAGHPSCVIAGTVQGVHRIIVAASATGIADGAWHSLMCERNPEMLRLMLDGVEKARQSVPASLEIVNDLPLRLGGKGIGPDNDQFHGAIDEVIVEIG